MSDIFRNYLLVFALLIGQHKCKLLDTSGVILSRQRRFLIWQEGINWVQMVAGIGLPTEIDDQSITLGAVIKSFYLLPTNSSSYTMPSIEYSRKKRSSASRWLLYSAIEKYIERSGYGDGKACLLRTICETASVPLDSKSGLLAEIGHLFLTPSSTTDTLDSYSNIQYHSAEVHGRKGDDCERLFPECTDNLIGRYTKFIL